MTKKYTLEEIAEFYGYSVGELKDMCSENSDLLYDLRQDMTKKMEEK